MCALHAIASHAVMSVVNVDGQPVDVPLHFALPPLLAGDADVLEARLRSCVYGSSAPSGGVLTVISQQASSQQTLAKARSNGRKTKFGLNRTSAAAVAALMSDLLLRLVRAGERGAAARLAALELGPSPREAMFTSIARDAKTLARYSSLDALQRSVKGELLVLLLPLDADDAAWDAWLESALPSAERGGAGGVMVHAIGVGGFVRAAVYAEDRLKTALTRAVGARAAADAFAAAVSAASAADAGGDALESALARLSSLGEPSAEGAEAHMRARAATLRLLSAAVALERGDCDAAAGEAARAAALALLQAAPGEEEEAAAAAAAPSPDMLVALERLDAALRRRAAAEGVAAAVADAAALEAASAPLADRLAAASRWQAALAADGASALGADADALARSLAHVHDAEALASRLAAPCDAADGPACDALRAAVDDASAAPAAVTGALATEIAAACRQLEIADALRELAAAAASGDYTRIGAAIGAATAVRAPQEDIARAIMQKQGAAVSDAAPAPAAAAPAAPAAESAASSPASAADDETQTWLPAGDQIRYNPAAVLGRGSLDSEVFVGVFLGERGRERTPAAVKVLRRKLHDPGESQLALVRREVDVLRTLNGASTRIVTLLAYFVGSDAIFMAFERCERSLAQLLSSKPPAPPPPLPPAAQRVAWLADVAAAVADCHELKIAHNDIHAGNVLLTDDGRIKLADLQLSGRARGENDALNTQSLEELGVQLNMARRAPEVQLRRKLTMKVDVWATGVLAFQLLTGRPSPFVSAKSAKQGPGGGAGGRRIGGPRLSPEAEENFRITSGAHDLSPLAAAGLPRHAAAEARHLLAAALEVEPERRPAAAALLAHPLFWGSKEAYDAIKALYDRYPEEEALSRAMERAGLADACARLANWRAVIHAPLLASCRRPNSYVDGFASLVRLARNLHEHPPLPEDAGVLPRAMPLNASVDERRGAVLAHLLDACPELLLATHVCLAAVPVTPPGELLRRTRRARRAAAAPADGDE
jgi:serine/threonine protein kinase